MKSKKEKRELTKLCYDHEIKNKVAGQVYFHEQICIQCLEDKVSTLWDHLGKQISPNHWDES